MAKYNVIIAVDPGLTGGISIIEGKKTPAVHKIPVSKIVVNKKKKNIYDLDAISEILQPYSGKNVLFVQELVSAMPNQGVTSSFNFGW